MGEKNQQGRIVPEQRNFKLYKAKKQWMTACATFLLTFGATAVMNVSANADSSRTSDGDSTAKTAELVQTANVSQGQTNGTQTSTATPAAGQEQTTSTSPAKQDQSTGGHPATVATPATPAT